MKLLFRYILWEVLFRGILILSVVTALMLLAEGLEFLEEMAHGKIPATAIPALLGLAMPKIAALALPLALFFGLLTTVSRLCLDGEMEAMAAAGIGLPNLLPVVGIAGGVGLILESGLTLWAEPAGEASMGRAMTNLQRTAITSMAQPGQFNEFAGGRVLYFRGRDSAGRMRRIFFQDPGPEPSVIITASRGALTAQGNGEVEAVFWQGVRYQGTEAGDLVRVVRFDRYRLHESLGHANGAHAGREALPTSALLGTVWNSEDALPRRTELYRRFALALSVPVFLLLALPFGLETRRSGKRSFGLLGGALFALGYYNALISLKEFAMEGAVAPHWLLWAIPVPTLAVAALLLHQRVRGYSLLPLPRARLGTVE